MTMTLDQLLHALDERTATRFTKALAILAQYEADPVILKSELAELRTYGLNRAFEMVWDALVRDPFFNAGKWQSLGEHEQKLGNDLGRPEIHTTAGYLKRVSAATKAEGPMRTKMIEVLEVLAPIAARAEALNAKVGKRPPKVTKASIEQAERDAKAMTCQICGRPILAETGVIAHHGYERPGTGWQTASCEGARQVPFEVSRDALFQHLVNVRHRLSRTRSYLAQVEAETVGITWTFEDRTRCAKSWEQGTERIRTVTRQTFDAVKIETAEMRKGKGDALTFDDLKLSEVSGLKAQINNLIAYIARQQVRHDSWSGPTHKREGDAWVQCQASQLDDIDSDTTPATGPHP